jgi:hypothetical protein
MDVFEFFIDDDRYQVPTFSVEEAAGAEAARTRAERLIARCQHYIAIHVYQDDLRLFKVTRTDLARA